MAELKKIKEEIIKNSKRLIENKDVNVVVGYKSSILPPFSKPHITMTTDESDDFMFDVNSVHNLTLYLLQYLKENPEHKAGIVLKGCDYKSLIVLVQERMIDRSSVKIIGFGCPGIIDPKKIVTIDPDAYKVLSPETVHDKCLYCDIKNTPDTDIFIGEKVDTKPQRERYFREIEFFKGKSNKDLLDFWKGSFSTCIRCYACRQVCPMCYCDVCISYRNIPQWIDLSPSPVNNMLFHLRRAMCMAGRCTDCGECERVCPVGIPLRLMYNRISMKLEELYDNYRAGMDIERKPILQDYNVSDMEDFIL
jgi:ferredoxin